MTATLWRREAVGKGESVRSLYIERPNAHDLERLDQLRTRLDPRGPRSGDEACGARVGRLLPDAAPRVRHADQAEALLPGARARSRPRRDRQGLGGREGPVRDRRGRGDRGADEPRRLPLDRDQPLRRRVRGRPDLLRPHLLPRSRPGDRGAAAVRAAAERDERERDGGARPVRAAGPGEALPDPAEGRRARARDPLPRRRRLLAGRDRGGGRGDERQGARSWRSRSR